MDTAYSGYLGRSAHFAMRPPVPGISATHEHPVDAGDIFQPMPDVPPQQAGDIWPVQENPPQGPFPFTAIEHWTDLQDPVPSNVHSGISGQTATDRMLANHSIESPNLGVYPNYLSRYPLYHGNDETHAIDYTPGRGSTQAGIEVPENAAFLVMGHNAFDATNQPNEVYSAEPGGRYRLGTLMQFWTSQVFWTKQGQDADLRAYTGLEPFAPVDKPRVPNSAPYTPNSSGTSTWIMDQFRSPSSFNLPAETSITDYELSNPGAAGAGGGDFYSEDTRL